MNSLGDLVGWIVAALFAVVFFHYRWEKASDNAKFKDLYQTASEHNSRLAVTESRLDSVEKNIIKKLDTLEAEAKSTSDAIQEIKLDIAKLPKRNEDA
jgi:hypothetical protein